MLNTCQRNWITYLVFLLIRLLPVGDPWLDPLDSPCFWAGWEEQSPSSSSSLSASVSSSFMPLLPPTPLVDCRIDDYREYVKTKSNTYEGALLWPACWGLLAPDNVPLRESSIWVRDGKLTRQVGASVRGWPTGRLGSNPAGWPGRAAGSGCCGPPRRSRSCGLEQVNFH